MSIIHGEIFLVWNKCFPRIVLWNSEIFFDNNVKISNLGSIGHLKLADYSYFRAVNHYTFCRYS